MKECIICKKKFISNSNVQKCCSKECSILNRINYEHSDIRKTSRDRRLRLYEQTPQRKQYRLEYEATSKRKRLKKEYEKSNKRKQYHRDWEKLEKRKEYKRQWLKTIAGKYKCLIDRAKRREWKNNCIHNWSKDEWKLKCELTNGVCPSCHTLFDNRLHKLTLDHILSLYWANEYFKQTGIKFVYTIDEIQPLCLSCNCSKQHKLLNDNKPNAAEVA